MATLFDGGFVNILTPIFVFLFTFAIIYAVLKKTELFGENDGVTALISFVVGMFTLMIPEAQVILSSFIPWFFLLFILVAFIFMFFMFMGVKNETLVDVIKEPSQVTMILAAVFILFVIAMTKAFGPFLVVTGQPGFWEATKRAVLNRRFLGLVILLFITAFTVQYIAEYKPKKK